MREIAQQSQPLRPDALMPTLAEVACLALGLDGASAVRPVLCHSRQSSSVWSGYDVRSCIALLRAEDIALQTRQRVRCGCAADFTAQRSE